MYNSQVTKDPPDNTTSTETDLSYSTFDSCTGTFLFASGSADTGITFSAKGQLDQATLSGTINVTDLTGQVQPVGFNLTWTSDGSRFSGRTINTSRIGTGIQILDSIGTSTNATVSGTLNGITLGPDNAFGIIQNNRTGTLVVTKFTK